MRAVLQRVHRASVHVEGTCRGKIDQGLLLFLGIYREDTTEDLEWLVRKIPDIRIFEDAEGKMNLSLGATQGGLLVISQFTLYGSLKKGTRPSFNRAAPPEIAIPLYEAFLQRIKESHNGHISSGVFGAHMDIESVQDGPVTLVLDTRNKDL